VAGLGPERAAGSSPTASDVPGLAEVQDDHLAELEGVGNAWRTACDAPSSCGLARVFIGNSRSAVFAPHGLGARIRRLSRLRQWSISIG